MHHESYPFSSILTDPTHPLARLLPKLPSQCLPTAEYQYRNKVVLHLEPHSEHPSGARGSLDVRVTRKICLGHGHLNQIVLCEVVNGSDSLVGAEVVALVFDSLYVNF